MPKKGANIENGLPTGWEWKTLGEVCEKASSNVSQNQLENENGIYNIYGASGFIKQVSFYHQDKPYVGIVKDGAGVGRVWMLEEKSSVIGTLQYLLPKTGIDVKYLYYKLQEINFQKYINGATIPHIYFKNYRNEPFLVVPPSEQTKIVTVLESTFSKIDKAIALVKSNIEKINQLNASVLDEVFEKLDKNHTSVQLNECSTFRNGFAFKSELFNEMGKGLQVIRIGNVLNRNKNRVFIERKQEYENHQLSKGELIISMTGTRKKKDYLFVSKIEADNYYLNQRVGAINGNKSLSNNFLYYYLKSNLFREEIFKYETGTVNQGNISGNQIMSMTIPLPSIVEQSKIANYIDSIYAKNSEIVEQYQTKLLSLQQLKNSVLESAFKGELRKDVKEKKIAKLVAMPALKKVSDKFIKIEILYASICANKKDNIKQGEMAIAKDMYLIDRIGGVPTGFQFAQHNWGAFDPEAKELIHTKQYFQKVNYPNSKAFYYDVKDNGKLLEKIPTEIKQPIFEVTNLLNQKIFAKYDAKQRPHKKELLATVLKCIEDTQSVDLQTIRTEMKNWETPKQEFKSKAEKFSESETKGVLGYILSEGWEKKVIK